MKDYKRVLLVSDTHFPLKGSLKEQKEFISFVEKEITKCDALFLLGDIFDFYYEYRHVIPKEFFPIYTLLTSIKDDGKDIHYWTGNHDFWHGEFFTGLGVNVHRGKTTMEIHKRVFAFAHGDGVGKFNPVNIAIKSDLNRFLFKYIHPDLGFEIARCVSRLSRVSSSRKVPKLQKYIEFAKRCFSEGAEIVVIGHIHKQYRFQIDGKLFIVLGDWMIHRFYGVIEDGNISLKRWNQSPR